ncbi:MAG: hypothetical protein HY320_05300 [Armatimonadetes bacterium]|nr:hypothetical protein [Armatimonadota bacterium]
MTSDLGSAIPPLAKRATGSARGGPPYWQAWSVFTDPEAEGGEPRLYGAGREW